MSVPPTRFVEASHARQGRAAGRERWLLIDDRSGKAIDLPGLNAQLAYAISREEVGVAPYYFASQARRLRWGNVDRSWDVPVSVEVGAREGRRSSSEVD
ncbi:MAG: hypothetical protein VX246_12940 [Myxococcota bacterium]|nr:hypothetical protein [Myxococcota bacterium]